MSYRKLNSEEISALKKNGCKTKEWENIKVKEDFTTDCLSNVTFGGNIRLGTFKNKIQIHDGIKKENGIHNSYLENCIIGDNTYISNVKNLVNYEIESDVAIEDVGTLAVTGETTFGNGTKIEVLNEGGGRELPIFDLLSAQLAYILVQYQHDQALQQRLRELIEKYILTKSSKMGIIRSGSRIYHTVSVLNVSIGNNVTIDTAQKLENGTIAGLQDEGIYIGEGVIAENFIIQSGSKISGGAILANTFVGQSVQIGKQFSAENTAFFANCEAFHGEACSLFAGPYTVTHHKSTLLIAGMFSFYNAGSGTNQSNHMYKLGPLHQGILERGSKTGSFSYLLWPARVGAFTAVIGKHYSNFDTTDLPFSYIDDANGKSVITPAMNLFTVGTKRDSEKWPQRDKRESQKKYDLINFDLFNPYSIGKMLNGIKVLQKLQEESLKEKEYVNYKGIFIKRLLLKRCKKYYELAVKVYFGEMIIRQLEKITDSKSSSKILAIFPNNFQESIDEWIDLFGMIVSKVELAKILESIKSGQISSLELIQENLKKLYDKYDVLSWDWCRSQIGVHVGKDIPEIKIEDLIELISDWKESSLKFNNMILNDSQKEFDDVSKIGFGIDGDKEIRDLDFQAVRGKHQENKFVLSLKKESAEIEQKAEHLINLLQNAE